MKAKSIRTLYIIKLWYYKIQTLILGDSDLNIKHHCYEFNYLTFVNKIHGCDRTTLIHFKYFIKIQISLYINYLIKFIKS